MAEASSYNKNLKNNIDGRDADSGNTECIVATYVVGVIRSLVGGRVGRVLCKMGGLLSSLVAYVGRSVGGLVRCRVDPRPSDAVGLLKFHPL